VWGRRLSLIVPKDESEQVELEFSPRATVVPRKDSYTGGDHMATINL
jgi:hypothetical protein